VVGQNRSPERPCRQVGFWIDAKSLVHSSKGAAIQLDAGALRALQSTDSSRRLASVKEHIEQMLTSDVKALRK